ncbi:MAG: hypothetical protein HZB19_18230 [Chloroflexi bacterium]|nr:hypothetical protein [Chloroflexota bacterium]
MTAPKDSLPKVPPFIQKDPDPPRHNGVDMRGLLSVGMMIISMGALTVSMGGAAKLVLDVFNDGMVNSMNGVWAKLIPLSMAFVFGWGVALVSIRGFGNLVYPIIIKIYAWLCLGAVCILYIKIIQKLYLQKYDPLHFWAYLFMLLGGLTVLIALHLLIEGHDLRPFAIPPLIISVVQLFVIVFRYVFTEVEKPLYLFGDIAIFFVMIFISALMLMHIGILASLRARIDGIFDGNGNGFE